MNRRVVQVQPASEGVCIRVIAGYRFVMKWYWSGIFGQPALYTFEPERKETNVI